MHSCGLQLYHVEGKWGGAERACQPPWSTLRRLLTYHAADPHVQAGESVGGDLGDAAFSVEHGDLPDGRDPMLTLTNVQIGLVG